MKKIESDEQLFESLKEAEVLSINNAVNLDELCAVYMIKRAINPNIQIEIKDFEKGLIVTDFNIQALAHKKGLSISKLIYGIIVKQKLTGKFVNSHNLLKLVDYCSRSTEKMLTKNERQKGSLINVIYAIRSAVSDYTILLGAFDYFAEKILENPEYLNTMCDIELSVWNPELAKEIYEEYKGLRSLMIHNLRFIKVDKYWTVYNTSNRNLARSLFVEMPNLIIYCFKSDHVGIIFRFALDKESEQKLREYLMENFNSDLEKKGKKIYILTNPDVDIDHLTASLTEFCLVKRMLSNQG